jgi:inorganic triphosphatase YgiF
MAWRRVTAIVETELKFQVPAEALPAIRTSMSTSTSRAVTLRARYFDTPDRRLAAAGIALRLRLEGDRWVQAVKAPGVSAMVRFEHEVDLGAHDADPQPDTALHAGTAMAPRLAAALAVGGGPLQVVFETRVLRNLRLLRCAGALVEVAFDVGELVAGTRRAPLCEVEFELKRGAVDGMLLLAARWVQRHGLWLDVRSKAERGDRLARGVAAGPAVMAAAPAIDAEMSGDTALRCIVGACLAQVLPNAADVAAGVAGPEQLHQLRVGLRRLRCALALFGGLSATADAAWAVQLRDVFGKLGASRDRDMLVASVLPALRAAGAPDLALPAATGEAQPAEALRGVAFNRLLLGLLGFAQSVSPPLEVDATERIGACMGPPLKHLRRQLRDDAAGFAGCDEAARHRARKRLKRLRYGLEFTAPLWAPKRLKRCLAKLKTAQELLGRYHDLAVAEQAFRAHAASDPKAWFAVGWLQAQREQSVAPAGDALAAVAASAGRLRRQKPGRTESAMPAPA